MFLSRFWDFTSASYLRVGAEILKTSYNNISEPGQVKCYKIPMWCIARAYLRKRFGQALQCKLMVTDLTVAAVGGSEPVLQTGLVHHGQATRAFTGGQQLPWDPAFMADPTEGLLAAQTGTQETTIMSQDSRVYARYVTVYHTNDNLTMIVMAVLRAAFSDILIKL